MGKCACCGMENNPLTSDCAVNSCPAGRTFRAQADYEKSHSSGVRSVGLDDNEPAYERGFVSGFHAGYDMTSVNKLVADRDKLYTAPIVRNRPDAVAFPFCMQDVQGFNDTWVCARDYCGLRKPVDKFKDKNRPDIKPDSETVSVTYTFNGVTPLTPNNTTKCDRCRMNIANVHQCEVMFCPHHDRSSLRQSGDAVPKCLVCGLTRDQTCAAPNCVRKGLNPD